MANPPTQTVSFFSAPAMLAPDLAVQQAQNDRAQQMAMALRQMSLEPVDPGKGAVSWTQGLAKLGDALAARVGFNRADNRQVALNKAFAEKLYGPNSPFGHYTGSAPASPKGGDQPSPPVPPQAGTTPLSTAPSTNPYAPGPSQAPPQPIRSVDPDVAAAAPAAPISAAPQAPAAPPQAAPAPTDQTSAAPGTFVRGPLSISDNPMSDFMQLSQAPESYWAAHNAQIAPTDFGKTLTAAGIPQGSPLYLQMMQMQAAKLNHMPLENGRGGSFSTNPMTNVKTYNPILPSGSNATFNPDGSVASVSTIPGAAETEAAMAGAKAGATAKAQTPYELVTVLGADGNYHQVPKSSLTGGGAPGVPGAPGAPPAGGSLNTYYGHGGQPGGAPVSNTSGLGPGNQQATATAGTNSANAYNADIAAGDQAKMAMRNIDIIMGAAKGLQTGEGAGALNEAKSFGNVIGGQFGYHPFDTRNIAKFDEIKKTASQLADQLSKGPAGSTDARLNNSINMLPNANYSPEAIQEVGLNLKAAAARNAAYAQAAANDLHANGPNNHPAFAAQWQRAYNPDLFYHMQKGDLPAWFKSLGATDAAHAIGQYRQLKTMGAF